MKYLYMLIISTLVYSLDGQVSLDYQIPHADILSLADVNPPPFIRIDSKAENALLLDRNMYKTIEELSAEELRLGGLRIDPKTKMPSRVRYFKSVSHLNPKTQQVTEIKGLPSDGQFSKMAWSHDQKKVALLNTSESGVSVWVIDIASKEAKKIYSNRVHGALGTTMLWLKDEESILIKVKPEGDFEIVDRNEIVPSGPTISENDGQKAQNRTYQDLLKNPTDEQNFTNISTTEIWKINIDGSAEKWLGADIYDDMMLSPDGKYILISSIHKPFSYIVPYYRFPYTYNIYDTKGNLVKTQFEIPLSEELPKGFMAVTTQPRRINWRSDQPATLYWAEALDGGDPETEVEFRDAIVQLAAPFTSDPEELLKTKERYSGISWCENNFAIAYEYWWNTRNLRTVAFNPENGQTELLNERNYQDRYNDPGSFVTHKNEFGKNVIKKNGGKLYLLGDGYTEEGKFPFIDEFDIDSKETNRLYISEDDTHLEDLITAIDIDKGIMLTRIESKNEFPNYFFRNFKTGDVNPITQFKNPFESLNSIHKEVITYQREDGLELSATLYLPVGYDKDKKEKMPMIMWAYPREFKDKSSAGQTTNNPNEFTFPYYGSPLYWANRGYVILDDAAFPIVGEGDTEPNDSFIEQLVANAKAAIDAVDEMGYIDRNRVAVGGHSYGAFMTANLLTHSDLFAAGIARSGAYNRTLTPFGFQSEERNYWEAPEVYNTMSPFMNADKMKSPLLLIHGEADNNSGTYPMQSERYFNALKGLGATVRLVMLPKESHGYAARESIMHLLWEQDMWLEKYVKNKEVENKD